MGILKSQSQSTNKEDEYTVLGNAFWRLMEHYDLTQKEQAMLLGIKFNKQRLSDMRSKGIIPDDADKALRVAHLLGIHKNLRILFPNNRDVVYAWLKTKRDLFGGLSALEYIGESPIESLPRLFTVRRILDQIRVGV